MRTINIVKSKSYWFKHLWSTFQSTWIVYDGPKIGSIFLVMYHFSMKSVNIVSMVSNPNNPWDTLLKSMFKGDKRQQSSNLSVRRELGRFPLYFSIIVLGRIVKTSVSHQCFLACSYIVFCIVHVVNLPEHKWNICHWALSSQQSINLTLLARSTYKLVFLILKFTKKYNVLH